MAPLPLRIPEQYAESAERENLLESRKDLFLSWFSSAVLFAIDANDLNLLTSLKEKFDALNRSSGAF